MTDDALPLDDRIALVTGASRGIGYQSALALALAGAHVVATGRTQGALEELDDAVYAATGRHATLVPFDLVDGGGIDRLGGAIFSRFGKLDIWVHAAATLGAQGLTPVSHIDPRGFAKIEKTNFTATYRLIRSLEPLLRQSDAARVIHLTTSLAREPKAFWGLYYNLAMTLLETEKEPPIFNYFLNYGLVDETLVSPETLAHLHAAKQPSVGHRIPVMTFFRWLHLLYKGEEMPSMNEMGVDYAKHIRELEKGLSAREK